MSRPSAHLDKKLVAAARAMLPEAGLSGLSVRAVARRARVNAGMFHYHFKTREAFLHRVLSEVYADFLVTFEDAARGPGEPRERLRRVLTAVARFAREHRVFYTLMIRELLNAQPEMSSFAKKNFPRHASVIMALMDECRRAGVIRPLPTPALCMFAMSTMAKPSIAVTAFERNGVRAVGGRPFQDFSERLLSDEMIEIRADMVMAALAVGRKK
jgi:AcrR family transcriptional regulator